MKWIPFVIAVILSNTSYSSFEVKKIGNNHPLFHEQDVLVPLQTTSLVYVGGPKLIPQLPHFLPSILCSILEEGPSSLADDTFRKKMFILNASFDCSCSARSTQLTFSSPADKHQEVLKIVQDILVKPRLDKKTFDKVISNRISNAKSSFESMRTVNSAFSRKIFYMNHDLLNNCQPLPWELSDAKFEHLEQIVKPLFAKERLAIASVGPLTEKDFVELINSNLQTEIKSEFINKAPLQGNLPTRKKAFLLHKPGVTDNQILFLTPEKYDHTSRERFIAQLTHLFLGDGLSGRLGNTLRVKRGLTYGAMSAADSALPFWTIYTFGGNKQAVELISGVFEVVSSFKKEKLKNQELEVNKKNRITSFREGIELPVDRLNARLSLWENDLDPGLIDRLESEVKSIRISEIEKFKKNNLNIQNSTLFVMGDETVLKPALLKAGYKPEEIQIYSSADFKEIRK